MLIIYAARKAISTYTLERGRNTWKYLYRGMSSKSTIAVNPNEKRRKL